MFPLLFDRRRKIPENSGPPVRASRYSKVRDKEQENRRACAYRKPAKGRFVWSWRGKCQYIRVSITLRVAEAIISILYQYFEGYVKRCCSFSFLLITSLLSVKEAPRSLK